MALSDLKCRKAACPDDKNQVKMADGGGLYLLVKKSGGRYWRIDYRYDGKRQTMALGVYPDVSLAAAREKRDRVRAMLDDGRNPANARPSAKGNTFADIAGEYLDSKSHSMTASTIVRRRRMLDLHAIPFIGSMPIDRIEAPDLLPLARRLEDGDKYETAHRVLNLCGQIFRYAIATGRARRDPSQDLRGALKPVVTTHRPAVTETSAAGELLRMIWNYQGTPSVIYALRLIAYTFPRPGEIRHAEWREIDWNKAEWRIPAAHMKMKGRGDHIVPLSRQAIGLLRELQQITGKCRLLFPGARAKDRPISDNTLNAAMRRMGIPSDEHVAHGFRAMARTMLAENGWNPEYIERQLAHIESNKVVAAYNRAQHLSERRDMMQWWSDHLDNIMSSGPWPI